MDVRVFEDALQQCLEGTADDATQSAVIEAAQENPEFRKALLDEAAFDAVLLARGSSKEKFVSGFLEKITNSTGTEAFTNDLSLRIQQQKKRSGILKWVAPLAIAASLLLVLGIGTLQLSRESTPEVILRISNIEGNPETFLERDGKSLPATNGVLVRYGDTVHVKGSGHIFLEDESRNFDMTLSENGRLTLAGANRLRLESGRLAANLDEHLSGSKNIVIETDIAESRIVGTRLIMFADPSNTRLRVEQGHVRFAAKARDEIIDVRASECAMMHKNRKQMLKLDYKPDMTVEGDIIFQDNFESDLSKWKAALVDKDGNISTYPGDMSSLATWKQVKRDGQTTGCMQVKGASKRPEGQPSLVPKNFHLPDKGFLLTLDIYYPEGAKLSIMSTYFENFEIPYNRKNKSRLFRALLRNKQWGHKKVIYLPEHNAGESITHSSKFYLDDKLLFHLLIEQKSPPLLTVKCRLGRALITDIVVKELLTFD